MCDSNALWFDSNKLYARESSANTWGSTCRNNPKDLFKISEARWCSNSDANKAEAVLIHAAIPCARHSNKEILVHKCTQALLGINSMACAIYREWQIQELLWLFRSLPLSLFKFRILFLSLYKAQCKSKRSLMAPVDLLLRFNWTRSNSDGQNLRQL